MRLDIAIGICTIILGIYTFIVGLNEMKKEYRITGPLMVVIGIYMILICIKTDNYMEWKSTYEYEILLQINDEEYVQDNGDEFLYKVPTFTDKGEIVEEYKHIVKDRDTFVECIEIENWKTAVCYKLIRENKNIFGLGNKQYQTKYVFYIPTN